MTIIVTNVTICLTIHCNFSASLTNLTSWNLFLFSIIKTHWHRSRWLLPNNCPFLKHISVSRNSWCRTYSWATRMSPGARMSPGSWQWPAFCGLHTLYSCSYGVAKICFYGATCYLHVFGLWTITGLILVLWTVFNHQRYLVHLCLNSCPTSSPPHESWFNVVYMGNLR